MSVQDAENSKKLRPLLGISYNTFFHESGWHLCPKAGLSYKRHTLSFGPQLYNGLLDQIIRGFQVAYRVYPFRRPIAFLGYTSQYDEPRKLGPPVPGQCVQCLIVIGGQSTHVLTFGVTLKIVSRIYVSESVGLGAVYYWGRKAYDYPNLPPIRSSGLTSTGFFNIGIEYKFGKKGFREQIAN